MAKAVKSAPRTRRQKAVKLEAPLRERVIPKATPDVETAAKIIGAFVHGNTEVIQPVLPQKPVDNPVLHSPFLNTPTQVDAGIQQSSQEIPEMAIHDCTRCAAVATCAILDASTKGPDNPIKARMDAIRELTQANPDFLKQFDAIERETMIKEHIKASRIAEPDTTPRIIPPEPSPQPILHEEPPIDIIVSPPLVVEAPTHIISPVVPVVVEVPLEVAPINRPSTEAKPPEIKPIHTPIQKEPIVHTDDQKKIPIEVSELSTQKTITQIDKQPTTKVIQPEVIRLSNQPHITAENAIKKTQTPSEIKQREQIDFTPPSTVHHTVRLFTFREQDQILTGPVQLKPREKTITFTQPKPSERPHKIGERNLQQTTVETIQDIYTNKVKEHPVKKQPLKQNNKTIFLESSLPRGTIWISENVKTKRVIDNTIKQDNHRTKLSSRNEPISKQKNKVKRSLKSQHISLPIYTHEQKKIVKKKNLRKSQPTPITKTMAETVNILHNRPAENIQQRISSLSIKKTIPESAGVIQGKPRTLDETPKPRQKNREISQPIFTQETDIVPLIHIQEILKRKIQQEPDTTYFAVIHTNEQYTLFSIEKKFLPVVFKPFHEVTHILVQPTFIAQLMEKNSQPVVDKEVTGAPTQTIIIDPRLILWYTVLVITSSQYIIVG